ncbi:peptidoglycan-binding protein [Shouchella sp. JSM 1781072]|uniref:peptidoglycan-binding domain-containing protein n=1 Tax=Bacillaceae TaxID=186817 RepID=UPI0020D0ABE8|nr:MULTISPECIES: peptidoglycan-binding protein [Bacillaceae]UTR08108.1 peptidoglycan-binding protein [Alkalihalobacillus sp. LMS6]
MKYMIGFVATLLLGVLFFLPTHTYAQAATSIEVNEESERVEWLQEQLVDQGFLEEEKRTSVFDEDTVDAVAAYQKDHGLSVDGIPGKQTLGALEVLKEGTEGPLVKALQERLYELKYYQDSVDGHYGQTTKQAVTAFQQANQLLVDGIAGPETHAHLYYNHNKVAHVVTDVKPQEQQPKSEPSTEEEVVAHAAPKVEEPKATEKAEEATNDAEEQQQEQQQTTEESVTEEATTEEEVASTTTEPSGQTMTMEATAYTAYCNGCSGVTRTGIDLRANPNQKVVAVDPNVIPLGSRVYVEGYGEAIAGDTGGAIKGHKIDLFVQTKDEAYSFGRQQVQVTVLD